MDDAAVAERQRCREAERLQVKDAAKPKAPAAASLEGLQGCRRYLPRYLVGRYKARGDAVHRELRKGRWKRLNCLYTQVPRHVTSVLSAFAYSGCTKWLFEVYFRMGKTVTKWDQEIGSANGSLFFLSCSGWLSLAKRRHVVSVAVRCKID